MKKILVLFLLAALGAILITNASGCDIPMAGREVTVTPNVKPPPSSGEVTVPATGPASTESTLPLLDTAPHGPLETAYFALG